MTDIFEPEEIYHIYNRAIGNEKLFLSEENYSYFLNKYHQFLGDKLETLAYCLIPNHFHFLVKIKPNITNEKLVKAFADFQNSYSKSFNKAFKRHGALFQRKFKRKKIDSEEYLSQVIIYIHLNPVKHKITQSPFDWNFSSLKTYLSEKPTKLNRSMALEWFGGLEGFRISHQENVVIYLPDEFQME
ncbi:transposase [Shivajiella indica]|uniref:Transposase n=1 Tax=Shivajiella indica TaxID=872115 RepID=A0ABW5B809_9BACT